MENEREIMVESTDEIVSVKEWLVSMLILLIPIVGIVMMFVWAFGGGVKKSKSNFFKAQLICAVIVSLISFILFATVGAMFVTQYM